MAYKIVDEKVVHISAPNNLTLYQSHQIENAKAPIKVLNLLDKMKQKKFEIDGREIRLSY